MNSSNEKQFECKRCGYKTLIKSNLLKHLRIKNPCVAANANIDRDVLVDELIPEKIYSENAHICKFCNRKFNSQPNHSRHQKICKQNKENLEDNELRCIVSDLQGQIAELKAQVQTSCSKQTPQQVSNTNCQTNNGTINYIINNFGKEDTSYITSHPAFSAFMTKCIRTKAEGVLEYITKKHFHPDHPENHNIRKLNKKDDFIEVKSGKEWRLRFKEDVLDDVFISIESAFANFVDEAFAEDGTLKRQWLDTFMASVGEPLDWDLSSDKYEYSGDMSDEDKQFLKERIYRLVIEGIYRNTKTIKVAKPAPAVASIGSTAGQSV